MSAGATLPLRDIHLPVAPPWWPPAPGWWLLAGLLLAVLGVVAFVLWRRVQRRRALLRMFDEEVAAAVDPATRVAAISSLLRRAARERDPEAAALQGREWLAFLDRNAAEREFDGPTGQLLLEGGYRRDVHADEADALQTAARRRFIDLAGKRR